MMNEITLNSNKPSQISFKLDERQSLIYERLNRLVGPGTAAFYKDACRHIAIKPPFVATTHIVGHLLREIESALRDVLESLTGPICKTKKSGEHKKEICVILNALGFKEADPVAQGWLQLTGEYALHNRAHRRNLGAARPVDQKFLKFWQQMESILYVILDRFESQYTKVFARLDALAKKDEPSKTDAQAVHLHIPNNLVAHHHFFSQLSNPKWLLLLKEEGMFLEPPTPEYDEESGGVRHLPWPAATYLEKMASVEPELITEILKKVKDVDNTNVKSSLLTITVNLPKERRLELIEKIKGWMKTEHRFLQLTLVKHGAKLINKFIEEGEENIAFQLATIFLEVLPDPKWKPKSSEDIYVPPPEPHVRLEHYEYNEFLEKEFQKLIELNPKRSFDLVCQLLADYMKFRHINYEEKDHNYEDSSCISRPAIENHEQNLGRDDVENVLITAARDIGLRIIKKDTPAIHNLFSELEARKWTVFRRLGFYLLSEVSDSAPDLVAKQLTNRAFFNNYHVKHEYAQLMRKGFRVLNKNQRKIILDWIEQAEEITERRQKHDKDLDEERAVRIKEVWQRDQLSYMKDDLPPDWKNRYEDLVGKYGEPEHPDFPAYMTRGVGPTSDIKAQELADMDANEMVERLKTWQPKSEPHGFGPTKEGLGRELSAAIKLKPEHFNGIADNFKDLDPTYVRAYIQGFYELLQQDYELNWEKMLELCAWVIQQPREIPGRKGGITDQDPHWGWTRKAIASLISRGANCNLIPWGLREKVWAILEPLTHDPNPEPADEKDHKGNIDDAYTLAINTTRGEAMNAVVEYALWVYRYIEKGPDGKDKVKTGFEIMPKVKAVLDWHLDSNNDSSIAVRSIYGRFFLWLLLMDRQWTLEHLDQIFPPGKFGDRLYNAAWDSLMLYVPAYDDPFEVLKGRYHEAVRNLGKVDKSRRRFTDRDERLAEHLMLFYSRGKIDLSDALLKEFWAVADDELRGHALDFIGQILKSEERDIDSKIFERTKALWESRISTAKSARNKSDYEKEMSAFGLWFASGRFDDKWSCEQYLEALEIGRTTQTDHFVVERLVELVRTLPLEAVKILSKLVLSDQLGWVVFGYKDEINIIFSTALQAPEESTREEAKSWINRLVARGHSEFSNLLSTPDQPSSTG